MPAIGGAESQPVIIDHKDFLNIRYTCFNVERIFHIRKEVAKGTGHERIAVFAILSFSWFFLMAFRRRAFLLRNISIIRQQGLE
jgi:hypothetical protein